MNNMTLKQLALEDFFLECEDFLSPDLCDDILRRYSEKSHLVESYPDQPSRSSKLLEELDMPTETWGDLLEIIVPSIELQIKNYLDRFLTSNPEFYIFSHATVRKFNRTITENIHYNTEYTVDHSDNDSIRNFFCILYLNKPQIGGEHVFPLQSKVFTPEKGKLVIYPTSFMFPNMSLPCYGDDKYLVRFNYHLDTSTKSKSDQYET